jgi:pimeloyl-ACP methyl ester carboxylesterase
VTAVFVHGVPETSAIWDAVRARLDVESVAVDLPGFAGPRPAGFGASKDEYAEWLAAVLASIDGPIDLVGHDWGALLAVWIATAFEQPLRSWSVDAANAFHPDHVWIPSHDSHASVCRRPSPGPWPRPRTR